MAKKQQNGNEEHVDCKQCAFGGEVFNHMIDCNNKERNPRGYKVGYWPRPCSHFKKKAIM